MNKLIKISLIGLTAGLINGMFSTGGGMILVPSLIYILKIEDKKSRGTTLFCILIMVITTGFFYYKQNYIDTKISLLVAIGGAIGGMLGAILLKHINTKHIKILFTCFLFYMSLNLMF